MDTSTLDLYHVLQSGPYDEAGLSQVKRLLGGQRRLLRSRNDLQALEQLIPMLEDWAAAAGGGWLSASALAEAAEIAEMDLRSLARAEQLRSQAIVTGRPAPMPESLAMDGAIDANAELLHELKTLPPGALTQTLVSEESEATEELDVEALRESSIPRPRTVPVPTLRSDPESRASGRPRTLHGYIAPDSSFGATAAATVRETDGLDDAEAQRDSSVEARRATPVPTLLSDATAHSDFPARLRSTPPPALRSVTEPRRASSVPAQPRATPTAATAAAASHARHPGVPTQPLRLTPLPQLSLSELPDNAAQERTQEVHTIDLELHPALSIPPLKAAEPANDDVLSAQIAQAEQELESDTSPERVRELAELYVKRDAEGDREQAADLYCTLGEVLGNPAGVAMLDRALALVPDHAEAKALLTRYAVPRMPISAPKITVLGTQPKLSVPQPPPPAAAGRPPLTAGAPPLAATEAQRTAPSLPPQASVQAAARATLPGTGPLNDVLSLHGVPQVSSTPPAVPPISSLTPIVRSDASELNARRLAVAKNSYVALGGIALSAAAALGLYLSVRAPSNHNAEPLARPEVTAAANQPLANPIEPEPEPEPETQSAKTAESKPAPLAPPGPSHLPLLKLESAQLRGGKLSETQLSAALGKAQPKLLACYEQAIEKKPKIKGRMIYGFTVRTNGRATNIKRVGGTLKDDVLLQCSAKVLETVRFPKPRKSAQVKLPIQYKRT